MIERYLGLLYLASASTRSNQVIMTWSPQARQIAFTLAQRFSLSITLRIISEEITEGFSMFSL